MSDSEKQYPPVFYRINRTVQLRVSWLPIGGYLVRCNDYGIGLGYGMFVETLGELSEILLFAFRTDEIEPAEDRPHWRPEYGFP